MCFVVRIWSQLQIGEEGSLRIHWVDLVFVWPGRIPEYIYIYNRCLYIYIWIINKIEIDENAL